ncbi:MAG: DEAD/DEAH box helicase [Spirochaetales bacterium]
MQFSELSLSEDLMRGINDLGFESCTDVQAATFEHTLDGRDVAVQSQTGTGKTAAFLISIFHLLNHSEEYKGSRALIVAPTRELAVQIENDAKALGKYLPQRTICIYGGVGYGPQEKALADKVDIVIGTPGRLLDFDQSRKIDFREMGIVVIDEADRLFDMGFYPDIRRILRHARPREERVTMLYSATLSTNVRNISWQFMNNPAEIEIAPEQMTVEAVEQRLYHVSKEEKFRLLLGLLQREKPQNALVFCNTKRATEIVSKKLQLNGYNSEFIIGDLPQKKRLRIIERLRDGEINFLCATDVAARGIHVDNLDMVVNYDLPEDPEAYVHRIGRTARAGKEGKAISLACERFVYSLEPIESLIGMRIPSEMASETLFAEDQSAGKRLPSTSFDERPPRRGSRHKDTRRSGGGRPRSGSPAEKKQSESHRHLGDRRPKEGRHAHKNDTGRPPTNRGEKRRGSHAKAAQTSRGDSSPTRDDSMRDRLEYYRQKYGEDFQPKDVSSTGASSSRSGPGKQERKPAPKTSNKTRSQAHGDAKTPSQQKPKKGQDKGLFGKIASLFTRDSRVDK